MSVGVMKDYKLKQTNLRASHTLDCQLDSFIFFFTLHTNWIMHNSEIAVNNKEDFFCRLSNG